MSYLEEWLIYSWIKFCSIKLRINLLSEDKKDSIPIDENTNPKEFMNIKFLCKFAQTNLDINCFNQKKDLNNQENYQSENNNDDFEMISNDQNHETNNQDRLIDEFITNMFKEYELNIEDIGKIMEILYGNIQSSQIFIDKIIFREKNQL